MCGIVAACHADIPNLDDFLEQLGHRGPDARGTFHSPRGPLLGHRRLSILDPSQASHQPMTSRCGRLVLVYNGEVYNYQELRQHLPDFPWRTSGDTEVVLELLVAYGPECLKWLNGMFALACHDLHDGSTLLARDLGGIKPLLLMQSPQGWLASSELKTFQSFAARTGASLQLDRSAVQWFLQLGYIPHPLTIYQGISKFPPGHYQLLTPGRTSAPVAFAEWSEYLPRSPQVAAEVAQASYSRILQKAVERQMVSDVPLGAFLSGGVDSSLVVAIASRLKPDLKTFSIAFDERGYDESSFARQVADHLGVKHQVWRVQPGHVQEYLERWIRVYDEPFGDSSALPTMLVSHMARQEVTVALSGDGGDETFLGYGAYAWRRRLRQCWAPWLGRLLHCIPGDWLNPRFRKAKNILSCFAQECGSLPAHLFSQEHGFFSRSEVSRLCIEGGPLSALPLAQRPDWSSPEDLQAWWDLHYYLQDDLLVKVDRASMNSSLEVRVPLLDQELVSFSLGLGRDLKLSRGQTKLMMRKELAGYCPSSWFDRPKQGFAIPIINWLRGPLRPLLDRYLNRAGVEQTGLVHWKLARPYLDRFLRGDNYYYYRVWLLLVLHWWAFECKERLR